MVMLDTCSLIELCLKVPQLKDSTLIEIEKGSLISSISFAEIHLKIKRGKLRIGMSAKTLYNSFRSLKNVSIVDVNTEIWFGAIDLKWNHGDPADRVITYMAKSTNSAIITKDRTIKKFYGKTLW